MSKTVILASLLSKARTAALARTTPQLSSLANLNQQSLPHLNIPQSETQIVVPFNNTFSEDTIILHNDDKRTHEQTECSLGGIEHDFIQYLKHQNLLRPYRREWLRYNLAMKDCSEELFLASSGKKDAMDRSEQQSKLYEMKDYLREHLRTFFIKTHNYSIYHKDLVFENNFFDPPTTYHGINAYILQLNKVRWIASFRYAHAKFEILKITAMETDHTVRVRWRITGLGNMAAFTKFWKFWPGKYRNTLEKESDWHDGYSTFYLNKEGVIVKHIVDRIVPDDEVAVDKKIDLAAKLSGLSYFLHPSFGD